MQAAIAETKFSARGAPRLAKDAPESVRAQRDLAKQLLSHFQDKLFRNRLLCGFGRFTAQEWVNGLERIAPYVQIVTRIVERYREAYAQAKSDAGVLDFWDLERRTYDLLREHPEIAAALRNRFRHVLVDEFQDINPIQESIIRLASREANAELVDNLFVVGDVKQSIYRFRLAEPDIFLDRQHKLGDAASSGTCIHLQHNFRSAPHIIDAVNHLFRRLLTRHVGGIEYDESAELRCGVATDSTAVEPSVELHLLQRRMKPDENDTAEYVDQHDPAEWSVIEREAYVIAGRIRTLVNSGETKPSGSLLGYGDIAVLLRAATHNAAPLAAMLGSLGIPACADVGGEFFDTLEVRDVLALLNVLDNMRQDIPLAAVLRGPMLGDPLKRRRAARSAGDRQRHTVPRSGESLRRVRPGRAFARAIGPLAREDRAVPHRRPRTSARRSAVGRVSRAWLPRAHRRVAPTGRDVGPTYSACTSTPGLSARFSGRGCTGSCVSSNRFRRWVRILVPRHCRPPRNRWSG